MHAISFNFQAFIFGLNVTFVQHIVNSMKILMMYLYSVFFFVFLLSFFSVCFDFCFSASFFLALC